MPGIATDRSPVWRVKQTAQDVEPCPLRRFLSLAVVVGLIAGCSSSVEGQGLQTSTIVATTSQASLAERLGEFAPFVLRGGEVPLGSLEHLQYLQSCLARAGFEVEIQPDEGALQAKPGVQEDEYRAALGDCEEAAFDSGLVGRPTAPTDEELAAWYEAFQLTYQCLLGKDLEPDPPPSAELYIESGGSNWHPYDGLSPAEISQVENDCPQDLVVLFERLNRG